MSVKEKSVKRSIEKLFLQLEHRQEQVNSSQAREEIRCHEHFSDTTRQIDIHREKLKEKIDDLALKMIDQTEEKKTTFSEKLNLIEKTDFNFQKINQTLMKEFRNPNLIIDKIEQIKNEYEPKFDEFLAKYEKLISLSKKRDNIRFYPNYE